MSEAKKNDQNDFARVEPKRNPEFEVHMLNDAGKANAGDIRDAYDDLLNRLAQMCPPGREFAICKTKLEESCFFAKKAMAVQPGNQLSP